MPDLFSLRFRLSPEIAYKWLALVYLFFQITFTFYWVFRPAVYCPVQTTAITSLVNLFSWINFNLQHCIVLQLRLFEQGLLWKLLYSCSSERAWCLYWPGPNMCFVGLSASFQLHWFCHLVHHLFFEAIISLEKP